MKQPCLFSIWKYKTIKTSTRISGEPVSHRLSFLGLYKPEGPRVSVTTHQPDPWWYLQVLFCSEGGFDVALKSVPITSNSASHSYLQATSVEAWSLIKAECCPDLSPFLLKCRVLCSMRKSFAAWFNEASVEPADLMTCENINLLPPRVLLLREAVYYSSKVLVKPFLAALPLCTNHRVFNFIFRWFQSLQPPN